jgi:hypothetical protein
MDLRGIGLREGSMDFVDPFQDRKRWRALVNPVMNLLVT